MGPDGAEPEEEEEEDSEVDLFVDKRLLQKDFIVDKYSLAIHFYRKVVCVCHPIPRPVCVSPHPQARVCATPSPGPCVCHPHPQARVCVTPSPGPCVCHPIPRPVCVSPHPQARVCVTPSPGPCVCHPIPRPVCVCFTVVMYGPGRLVLASD